jgi:hypothetical protein
MAYISRNLSVLAYANGFTLWHYTTPDVATTIDTGGYFNSAADMVRVGDMILVNADTAGTPVAGMMVVATNTGASVDVANLTQFNATNSD